MDKVYPASGTDGTWNWVGGLVGKKRGIQDADASTSNSWLKDGARFSKCSTVREKFRRRKLMALLWIFAVREAS